MRRVLETGRIDRLLALHHQALLEHLASKDASEMPVIAGTLDTQRERVLDLITRVQPQTGADMPEAASLPGGFHSASQRYFDSAHKALNLSADFEKEAAFLLWHVETQPLLQTSSHVLARLLDYMNLEKDLHDISWRLIRKDGRECNIAFSGAPLRNHQQRVCGLALVLSDVTEKHSMAARLTTA